MVRRRRSIRLAGHDYAQAGAYYVTVCTRDRGNVFGEAAGVEVVLNECGRVVQEEWTRSTEIRREIELDSFVVMPNHIHGIVMVVRQVGAHGRAPLRNPRTGMPRRAPKSLGSFVAGFKSVVTARVNRMRNTPGAPVWQRGYYEHVIRDEASLDAIRRYVVDNPSRWAYDRENPQAVEVEVDDMRMK